MKAVKSIKGLTAENKNSNILALIKAKSKKKFANSYPLEVSNG